MGIRLAYSAVRRLWRGARLFTLGALLTGCGLWSVGPDFTPPAADDMPARWLAQSDYVRLRAPLHGDIDLAAWWQGFHDPALTELIRRGRAGSPSLEAALLKIAQYRALYCAAVGAFFPQSQDVSAAYTVEHPSKRTAAAPQPGRGFLPGSVAQWNVGLQATWEIDLWGRYRRSAETARAQLAGAHAAYGMAQVSLSADIAEQYFTYRQLERQLRITRRNSAAQAESVRLTRVMYELGASSERDYNQALSLHKGTLADIPALQARLTQSRNALCLLLGLPPQDLPELHPHRTPVPHTRPTSSAVRVPLPAATHNGASDTPRIIPTYGEPIMASLPRDFAVGVPADLLRRRPDVLQAEAQAAAQCARIGVAKAALFPAFSLGGFLGFQSSNVGAFSLDETLTQPAFTANFSPSVLLPVFNYGRLYNAVRAQDAAFQQSLVVYRQTVLTALQEAENALDAYARAHEQVRLLADAASAARRSTQLALAQYREGATDFTTVVTAQSAQYAQENSLAAAGAAAVQAVGVFRAVGGGWSPHVSSLPDATLHALKARTHWGGLLDDMHTPPPHQVPPRHRLQRHRLQCREVCYAYTLLFLFPTALRTFHPVIPPRCRSADAAARGGRL